MSWKPSFSLGSLNRDLNPVNASLGNDALDSGFIVLFSDLAASLCSHTANGVLNHTQRMGTLCCFANSIHTARVSGSALVLSIREVSSIIPDED